MCTFAYLWTDSLKFAKITPSNVGNVLYCAHVYVPLSLDGFLSKLVDNIIQIIGHYMGYLMCVCLHVLTARQYTRVHRSLFTDDLQTLPNP
jgi:hypothetical protein